MDITLDPFNWLEFSQDLQEGITVWIENFSVNWVKIRWNQNDPINCGIYCIDYCISFTTSSSLL